MTSSFYFLKMTDVFYHDNINFISKRPIHCVLECVEYKLPVWTESKGHIRSLEGHISDTIILPHDFETNNVSTYFSSGDMIVHNILIQLHIMCYAEHINFRFSHVTEFIHWMSLIIVLNFCSIIYEI